MMDNKNQEQVSEDKDQQISFLVVDGKRVITIEEPVINIGRKSDNHIVIDDEHVSRYHAQIRAIKGRYVIMDLNSTVGTSVNGKQIDQVVLRPGDVISLGGVPIIFGQGSQKPGLDPLDSGKFSEGDSRPTQNTGIQSADKYLELFDTTED
jgi:pSer/pThr/pTyr-binding forkhead associated (FHA) protein